MNQLASQSVVDGDTILRKVVVVDVILPLAQRPDRRPARWEGVVGELELTGIIEVPVTFGCDGRDVRLDKAHGHEEGLVFEPPQRRNGVGGYLTVVEHVNDIN